MAPQDPQKTKDALGARRKGLEGDLKDMKATLNASRQSPPTKEHLDTVKKAADKAEDTFWQKAKNVAKTVGKGLLYLTAGAVILSTGPVGLAAVAAVGAAAKGVSKLLSKDKSNPAPAWAENGRDHQVSPSFGPKGACPLSSKPVGEYKCKSFEDSVKLIISESEPPKITVSPKGTMNSDERAAQLQAAVGMAKEEGWPSLDVPAGTFSTEELQVIAAACKEKSIEFTIDGNLPDPSLDAAAAAISQQLTSS